MMKRTNLQETETVEFKKSTSELKEGIISIVSILNKHKKGELYFGISNSGKVVGQTVSDKTLRDVSRAISDKIEPKVYPKINVKVINCKKCVHVMYEGDDAPYFAYGRAYVRVADEDKKISAKELENMILRKNKEKLVWDGAVCEDASITDINITKLKSFLKNSGKSFDSARNAFRKLGLISGNKLLNASVILFGKKPEKFFRSASLRCAVFAREDTSLIVDRQEFMGDLFDLIEKAEKYVLEHINIGMKVEGLKRIDVPEIDKEAFREAIVNAFCHRDYLLPGSVDIAIFKDRLEVRSPGLLYGGLTISKIRKENVSERRNDLIAKMFHDVHFVERWGRGISLILSKEPTAGFKEVGRQFITVFRRKEVEGLAEGLVEGLVETQKKILLYASKDSKISKKELAGRIGVSETAVDKNISQLKKKGLLKRIGPAKGGYWKVLE